MLPIQKHSGMNTISTTHTKNTTYLISDLHLHASRPKITERFFQFLGEEAAKADALYILGDFFEVWMGMDAIDDHDTKVLQRLSEYAKTGIPVYFMHGNRDFLIGNEFAKRTGAMLISDPYEITVYGTKYLLTHGDALCSLDISYQRFRKFVRHPFITWLYLSLPKNFRKKIAKNLRAKSSQKKVMSYTKEMQDRFDVTQEAIESLLQSYPEATHLVHGHTHKPGTHTFSYEGKAMKRIVMGDWLDTEAYVLKITPSGFQLEDLEAKT